MRDFFCALLKRVGLSAISFCEAEQCIIRGVFKIITTFQIKQSLYMHALHKAYRFNT